jgi:hypothetical protein
VAVEQAEVAAVTAAVKAHTLLEGLLEELGWGDR